MLRSIFLVVLAVTTVAMAVPAKAADLTIAVIDMQQILSESEAAKSIKTQIDARREALKKEASALETDWKKARDAAIAKRAEMSKEDLAKAEQDLNKKLVENRSKIQKSQNALEGSMDQAVNELRKNLVEVTSALATEKKIQLVITKQNVVIGDMSLDITKEVMTRLNAKVKNIKLAK